jgi:hypothetical protein
MDGKAGLAPETDSTALAAPGAARPDHAPAGPAEAYRTRRERAAAEGAALARRGDLLANLRLLAFVPAVAALGAAIWRPGVPLGALTALLFALFFALVAFHRRVDRRRVQAARVQALNEESLARLERRWEDIPLRHAAATGPQHPYARDLDLAGPGSLLHLLQVPATSKGLETVAAWLGAPALPPVVAERQVAVAELAPRLDFRQQLSLHAAALGAPLPSGAPTVEPDGAPFLRWVEAPPWITARPLALWAARLAPLLLLLTAVASATGLTRYPLWLLALVLNGGLHLWLSGRALADIGNLLAGEEAFRAYAGALRLVTVTPCEAPLLRRLQGRLTAPGGAGQREGPRAGWPGGAGQREGPRAGWPGGVAAHTRMERLYRLTGFALPPSHLLYLPIQVATLWNVHLLVALEGWRSNAGGGAGPREWLETLGEVEALGALAGLAYDNPDWAVPRYVPDQVLEAGALAHPLLAPGKAVPNDVRLGPPGTFLLVTGSNMAGKSTLLRALGANVVLAGAGAPVCARWLRLPPVRLWTAMRVEDSLRGGVSTFLAEARRIKAVVDAAGDPGPRLLYLLDEPFRGTNARERRIAVQRVIAHLVGSGAIGAVATHDLDLADGPPLAPAARPVHFSETVVAGAGGPGMTFDYRARPGLATSTNALRVLELVGLPTGESAPPGQPPGAGEE